MLNRLKSSNRKTIILLILLALLIMTIADLQKQKEPQEETSVKDQIEHYLEENRKVLEVMDKISSDTSHLPEPYKTILEHQIEHNNRLAGKMSGIAFFDGFYAPNCPMLAPIIHYLLNSKAKFNGIFVRQGYNVAYFSIEDGGKTKNIEVGYYDEHIAFEEKPSKIKPIYNIYYEGKTPSEDINNEQITAKIVNDICRPLNEILDKYPKQLNKIQ